MTQSRAAGSRSVGSRSDQLSTYSDTDLRRLWQDRFFAAQATGPRLEHLAEVTDDLLAEAHRRSDHELVVSLLRGRTALRRYADRQYNVEQDCIELEGYARQHHLTAGQASAWAMRAAWWLGRQDFDLAVDALARAIPMLDDTLPVGYGLSAALGDCLAVYQQLALYELAVPLWQRITAVVTQLDHPDEALVVRLLEVIFHLGWALHLERVAAWQEAAERFAAADTLIRGCTGQDTGPLGPAVPLLAAVCRIFADDDSVDPDEFRALADAFSGFDPDETAIVRIATARVLRRHGRNAEAAAAVEYDDHQLSALSRSSVAAAVSWEAVRCEHAGDSRCELAERHARRAEQELWALRQLRLRHATERIAHERLRRERDEAARLAREDTLTGLPNRRHLNDAVPAAVSDARREGRPLSLAIIDLDGFKAVNDEYSHRFGDQVLRDVAEAVQASVRSGDLIGRFGGDEFVALFTDTDSATAATVMRRAAAAVAALRWPTPTGTRISISLSVGVASLADGVDLDGLYALADQAMYEAKRAGGNRVRTIGGAAPGGPASEH